MHVTPALATIAAILRIVVIVKFTVISLYLLTNAMDNLASVAAGPLILAALMVAGGGLLLARLLGRIASDHRPDGQDPLGRRHG